jgi:hypothetical protein
MRSICLAALLAAVALPSQAVAMCYTVYGPNAAVIWRGSNPPIDLSKPVSEAMRSTFPAGNYLVISDETKGCDPVGPQDYFGPIPGLTGRSPGMAGMEGRMTASGQPRQ